MDVQSAANYLMRLGARRGPLRLPPKEGIEKREKREERRQEEKREERKVRKGRREGRQVGGRRC